MLVLVLLLVVASLGLLIAALTTANTLWAWISVLLSVVAAGLLVLDWVRNRRRRAQEAPATDKDKTPVRTAPREPVGPAISRIDLPTVGDTVDELFGNDAGRPREPVGPAVSRIDLPTVGEVMGEEPIEPLGPDSSRRDLRPVLPESRVEVTVTQPPVTVDPAVEPAEENTDATDLLVVSELSDEVVVIDERPRYHLAACVWLGGRPTMPLRVSEARELGFTPCAQCSPDSTLAARHRARR
jgi:hypothetical protein